MWPSLCRQWINTRKAWGSVTSVLLPLEAAFATAIENCRRLVCRANLDLLEECSFAAAALGDVRARDCCSMGVLEGLGTPKHIVELLPLQVHFTFELCFNAVDVGARPAEKAHIVAWLLREQDVWACGTEKHSLSYCWLSTPFLR